MPSQFDIRSVDEQAVANLQQQLDIPRFIAQTLVARGLDTPDEAEAFMNPSLERDWLNPYDIPGMADVATTLERAVKEHLHVVVFGDFDLDGISATTVLTRGLRALGCRATPFIPRRFEDGYALTASAFERVKQLAPDIIVTVDCGIACREEVLAIVKEGVEVAITDHHEAGDLVPQGVPVTDPKLDPACESSILAGVGVALKLVQILGSRMGYPHLWRSYTDFATLGTVADLMPMVGENRALVADGLARINDNPRPCIKALIDTATSGNQALTATNLSFSLVPRLNAAGRMGDAQIALDLLMTDKYDDALVLARELEEINNSRRAIEAELSEAAKARAEEIYHGQRALVVAGEGWHEGVKGIVASRLVNTYGIPTLLFTIEDGEARGSGRSVGSVNLFKAVESTSDLLTRFGGHEAAVGVTLPAENLDEFARRLDEYMAALPEEQFSPSVDVDATVDLGELTLPAVETLDRLAPFGQENPVPVFVARSVTLSNCRAVGADKNHFSCTLTDGISQVSGIMFHCSTIDALLLNESVVDVAFTVQVDEWRGRRSVKAVLEDVEPARTCEALEACLDPEAVSFFDDLFAVSEGEAHSRATHPDEQQDARRDVEQDARDRWERLAAESPAELENEVIRAIIGDRPPHDSQRAVLDRLAAGRSTFAVMATGRGKSLTFTVHAALRALVAHEASLFIYPLRALISDQYYHLSETLSVFGIRCAVLTGESSPAERQAVFDGVADGSIDIVLTTPEFFVFHSDRFAATHRFGFVVIDEAHHIGLAKAGQRLAYTELREAIARLGSPVVLAVTATSPDAVTEDIDTVLPVETRVVDETSRDNLSLDDRRNIRNRDDYLAMLIASGEKTVVYVNSREQSVALARALRRRVPHLAHLIGFYNAGLSREERRRVETLFRRGDLAVLVATSAFGEGIDIPDIRHVVLYHMPFNEVEFNQMSGRAGRDGKPAVVHLLYGKRDVAMNQRILSDMTPDHDVMAHVYRSLRAMQRRCPEGFFPLTADEMMALAAEHMDALTPSSVKCGVDVFTELGLIESRLEYREGRSCQFVRVNEGAPRVELTDSVRYREGLDERSVFEHFRDWALRCDEQGLIIRVSHPIVPTDPDEE